jgi:alpha-beta hydrolase superfamily lysophospholipase
MDWKRICFGKWSWMRPFQSLVAVYLLLVVVALFFADRLIFIPPPASYEAETEGLLFLETETGEKIAAIHHPAVVGMPTLLYSHGNAEDLGQSTVLYEIWAEAGLGVMAYDYPGYGQSTGKPDEAGCERAIQAAWDHLIARGVPAGKIVVVGRSVGSGPATWLASREAAAGLVLIAPFTSAFAVMCPVPLFPGDRFPNLKRIRDLRMPLLVLNGDNDGVIASSHGRKLVEASPAADKAFHLIPDAGHNDLFEVAGEEIIGKIDEFVRRVAK